MQDYLDYDILFKLKKQKKYILKDKYAIRR